MRVNKTAAVFLVIVFAAQQIVLPFTLQDDRVTIAMVDFTNTSADNALDYLEKTIPESISTSIAKGGRLEIVERSRLEAAMQEMEMGQLGIVDEATAAQLGRAVGANAILVGSFVAIGNTIRINARLIDVQTGKVINAESVQGRVGEEIFDLMDAMALSMEQQLVGASAQEAAAPESPVPAATETQPQAQPAQPSAPQQPRVVQGKSSPAPLVLLAMLGIGGVAAYFLYTELAPSTVGITVNIQP